VITVLKLYQNTLVRGPYTINLREVPLSSCITARNTLG
jgi:hypothetical protein